MESGAVFLFVAQFSLLLYPIFIQEFFFTSRVIQYPEFGQTINRIYFGSTQYVFGSFLLRDSERNPWVGVTPNLYIIIFKYIYIKYHIYIYYI